MSRKKYGVPVSLDTGNIRSLPEDEIRMILRAADPLVGSGGRNLLVKELKGSKEKAVLEHQLDTCPAYGYYSGLPMDEVAARVDWMIRQGYLEIFYSGRLPLLIFSEKGWAIERETYAQEKYQKLLASALGRESASDEDFHQYNREVRLRILELIEEEKESAFLPLLEAWSAEEPKKIRARIGQVQDLLKKNQGRGRRLAILFPGLGYTCDRPLLYYAGKLAEKHGFVIRRMAYSDLPDNAKKDPGALRIATLRATSQTFAALDSIDFSTYDRVLLISKSIGTKIASSYLEARGIRASSILLTPLEETFQPDAPADLAFHGTKDPWAPDSQAIRTACTRKKIRLIEIEGANHSLETGDIQTDIRNLGMIMQEIDGFLTGLS